MQYTSKIALLAVALFGTSALAVPIVGVDVEAREINDDLSAREFYDMYLEARADPSLDARDLESLDFEAREYLDYLEARDAAQTAYTGIAPSQMPHSGSSSHPDSSHPDASNPDASHPDASHPDASPLVASQAVVHPGYHDEHPHSHHDGAEHETKTQSDTSIYLTQHQLNVLSEKKAAAKLFKDDPKVYKEALICRANKLHRYAVWKYLSNVKNLKEVLENSKNPFYKAAIRILHKLKAEVYLSDKKNYEKALEEKDNIYHKDAVKMYLSHGEHFKHALVHQHAHFHKAAVHEYLLDTKTRKKILSDKNSVFYEDAMKLQKKIARHHKHLTASAASSHCNATVPSTTPHAATTSAAPAKKGKY